jgi:hypothetical protein
MRLSIKILSLVAAIASTLTVKADTLDFTLTGGSDIYTFSLPSDPSPDSTVIGTSFTLSGVLITQDPGTPTGIAFSTDVTFSETGHGGGLQFPLPSPPPLSLDLDLTGPQLYTGSEISPMFSPTSTPFTLEDGNSDTFTLDIAAETIPEPSSIALLATGLLTLSGTTRRRFFAR